MGDSYIRPMPSFVNKTLEASAGSQVLPDVWVAVKSLAKGHYKDYNDKDHKVDATMRNNSVMTYPHYSSTNGENRRSKLLESTGITSFEVSHSQAISMVDSYTIHMSVDEKDIDKIEALYMSPGITLIMEWGHRDAIKHSQIYSNNPPDSKVFKDKGSLNLMYKKAYPGFDRGVRNSEGKYNYAIASIINFSHSFNAKLGIYNAVVNLVGVGYVEAFTLFGDVIGGMAVDPRTKNKDYNLESFIGNRFVSLPKLLKDVGSDVSNDSKSVERISTLLDMEFTEYPDEVLDVIDQVMTRRNSQIGQEEDSPLESIIPQYNTPQGTTGIIEKHTLSKDFPQLVYYPLKSLFDYLTKTGVKIRYHMDYNSNMNPINNAILSRNPTEALVLTGSKAKNQDDLVGQGLGIYLTRHVIERSLTQFKKKPVIDAIRYYLNLANESLYGYANFTIAKIGDELVIYDSIYVEDRWFNNTLLIDASRKGLKKGIIKDITIKTQVPKNVLQAWTVAGRIGKKIDSFNFFTTFNSLVYKEETADEEPKADVPKKEEKKTSEEQSKFSSIVNYIYDWVSPSTEKTMQDFSEEDLIRQRLSIIFKHKTFASDENSMIAKNLISSKTITNKDIGATTDYTLTTEFLDPVRLGNSHENIVTLNQHLLLYYVYSTISIDEEMNDNIGLTIETWEKYTDELVAVKQIKPHKEFKALPIDVNITITGVAGIAPFMFFRLKGTSSRLRNKKMMYQITSVNEKIENHNWDVSFSGMLRTDMIN